MIDRQKLMRMTERSERMYLEMVKRECQWMVNISVKAHINTPNL